MLESIVCCRIEYGGGEISAPREVEISYCHEQKQITTSRSCFDVIQDGDQLVKANSVSFGTILNEPGSFGAYKYLRRRQVKQSEDSFRRERYSADVSSELSSSDSLRFSDL